MAIQGSPNHPVLTDPWPREGEYSEQWLASDEERCIAAIVQWGKSAAQALLAELVLPQEQNAAQALLEQLAEQMAP